MRARDGISLLELAAAIAIAGVVGAAFSRTLTGAERLARSLDGRLAVAEAVRTTRFVLGEELRAIEPGEDLGAAGPDSLSLRAFRGLAVVCGAVDGQTLVRYRGVRAPEPEKDSVVAVSLSPAGPSALAGSEAASGCTPRSGETVFRWSLADRPAPGTLLLLFERGSYHIAEGALRYRRGAGGRQPLTATLIVDRASGLHGVDRAGAAAADPALAAGVAVRLTLDPPGDLPTDSSIGPTTRFHLRLLNATAPTLTAAGDPGAGP